MLFPNLERVFVGDVIVSGIVQSCSEVGNTLNPYKYSQMIKQKNEEFITNGYFSFINLDKYYRSDRNSYELIKII